MLSNRLIKKAVDDETMKKEFVEKIKNRKITQQEMEEFPLFDAEIVDLILANKKYYNFYVVFESMCNNAFVMLEGKALDYFIDKNFYGKNDLAKDIYNLPYRLDYFEHRFNVLFRDSKRQEKLCKLVDNKPDHPFAKIFKEITKEHIKKQRIIKSPELLQCIKKVYSYADMYERVLAAAKKRVGRSYYST